MVLKQINKLWEKNQENCLVKIPLDKIIGNPYQPRKNFAPKELNELAQSILAFGVIQPIIVRKDGDKYQIIAGERRYRACELLKIKEIPAIIQDMDDEKVAAVSLIENLQRKELNYFEEAAAYNRLINSFGLTQDELAQKIGRSQSAIANKLRLLRLDPLVRDALNPEVISERHARALLKINLPSIQLQIIEEIINKELTVKDTEELVEKISKNNIMPDNLTTEPKQNISMIIKDARIFINTIKETVKRAKQIGVDISIGEKDSEDDYEITIRIAKGRRNIRQVN